MTQPADFILTGAGELLTLDPELGEGPLGVIRGGALAAAGGKIIWVGKTAQVHKTVYGVNHVQTVVKAGQVVWPNE